jgi:hypothetical protein
MPATPNRSMLLLRRSIGGGQGRLSSVSMAISSAAVNRSSHWLRAIGFLQFTIGVRTRLRAASSVMARTFPARTARSASTSREF